MTVIEIRRPAREKDCAWCEEIYRGKRKAHKCTNPKSAYFNFQITLKDLVCSQWELQEKPEMGLQQNIILVNENFRPKFPGRIGRLQWFSKYWWKYLLEEPRDKHYTSSWKRFWCRARGHPSGCWYYNPGGSEPDYRCMDCGDEL